MPREISFVVLLVLANLLTLLGLTVALPRTVRWSRYSAPFALLIVLAQMLIEGARWQMIPACVLSGLFFLVWLLQRIAPASHRAEQQRTHRVAFGLALGLGVFALALHRAADGAAGVSPAASTRSLHDWHVDVPPGGCPSPRSVQRRFECPP
jgi:hypothetical protein